MNLITESIIEERVDPTIISKIQHKQKLQFMKHVLNHMHNRVTDEPHKSVEDHAWHVSRQFKTGLNVRDLSKAYKDVHHPVKEDAPVNSVAGGGVSLPADAKHTKPLRRFKKFAGM